MYIKLMLGISVGRSVSLTSFPQRTGMLLTPIGAHLYMYIIGPLELVVKLPYPSGPSVGWSVIIS